MIRGNWFTEALEQRTAFSVRYGDTLFDENSTFQRVQIFESEAMGRVLILGGCFMVTEKDSFIYHEMLVHPAMAVVREPRKVLVIGGGDGGTVTEIVRYAGVESVILCEIDPLVVSACRAHLPKVSAGLSDPRVTVVNEDGAAFVARFQHEFDVILVDSTDPVGPGVALYETSFYESVRRGLRSGGAAVVQTESPLFMEDTFSSSVSNLGSVFGEGRCRPYLATIPSYPGALWSFTFCSEDMAPVLEAPESIPPQLEKELSYYSAEVHRAAFALPVFVRRLLRK